MIGRRVEIKAGDEAGGWGVITSVAGKLYHVAMYASTTDVRVFERSEIRIPRV